MTFASDNWAGASEKVMAALAEANEGTSPAYGNDMWTGRALDALSAFFERDLAAFFVSTGTAANSLAIATLNKPGGVVFCHVDAHLARDEAGAPLLFSPGTAIDTVDGPAGRMDANLFAERLAQYPDGSVHSGRPGLVSITNINEIGQCYSVAEVAQIAAIAKQRGCAVHMDGARFSNAVAHLKVSPAALTWRAGVDVISLGLTKTGGWCAEMVVFFDKSVAEDAMYRHKQSAQLLSKNRFASAQACALLNDNHAIDLATHANAMAAKVARVLHDCEEAVLLYQPQSNEVFAYLSPAAVARLDTAKIVVAPWVSRSAHLAAPPAADWRFCRFVASFRTIDGEVEALDDALKS